MLKFLLGSVARPIALAFALAAAMALAPTSAGQANGLALQAQAFENAVQFPTRESFAEVISLNESRLAVQASGVVEQWHADVGTRVKADELLLSLDDRDAQLALAQAQAARASAQARTDLAQTHLKRAQELTKTGFVSQEALSMRETELVMARAELASAQASEDLARRALEKMQLRAPYSGVVLERLAQIGEKLPTGTVAFVMTDPGSVEVQAQLSAEQITSLERARTIEFILDDQAFTLTLLRVSPVASLPSRNQTVRLGFEGESRPVAGTTGQLRWQVGAPVLSAQTLVRRQGDLGIFVLEPSGSAWLARFVPIAGAQEGRRAAAPPLAPDTLVVTNGQQRLRDGQVIESSDFETGPS